MLHKSGFHSLLESHSLQAVSAHAGLEAMPLVFNWIQVRRVGRQEQSAASDFLQNPLHRFFAMKARIIQDQDLTRPQEGAKHHAQPQLKQPTMAGAVKTQGSDQRQLTRNRLPETACQAATTDKRSVA